MVFLFASYQPFILLVTVFNNLLQASIADNCGILLDSALKTANRMVPVTIAGFLDMLSLLSKNRFSVVDYI